VSAAVRSVLDDQALDQIVGQIRSEGMRLTGPGGFLTEMLKAVLEWGLAAELTEHLGYDKHDPAGANTGNSRNGSMPKTLLTEVGPVPVDVPRDRAGTFTPALAPKGERRLGGLPDCA
jgi:transposase-like protein